MMTTSEGMLDNLASVPESEGDANHLAIRSPNLGAAGTRKALRKNETIVTETTNA